MNKEIKKLAMMSMAITGALYACAKEELLRYPDSTKAKLVDKGKVLSGTYKGTYCYDFDLNNTPGTAEMQVCFPEVLGKDVDLSVGACKTVADIRLWAAKIYSVNTSTPMPEYTKVKGKKVLKPEKCEYIKGLYKTDPVNITEVVEGAYAKEYGNRLRKKGRTR